MKTMGFGSLRLVSPARFPATEATVMAAGADDVLDNACVFPDVASAVADCGLIIGTTSRSRHLPWRVVEPRAAAREASVASGNGNVALLFGAERTGLSNDDIERCQLLLSIPTGSSYSSLNVAMAVQVVAYELLLAMRDEGVAAAERGVPLASAAEMEHFYAQLGQVMEEVDFRDRNGEGHLMARIRRLFNRAVVDQNEMNILRGILTAVQGRRRRAGDPHAPRTEQRR
jgi:tRNA (cytidine32/uridine32-2'-O)-methyltransferase